MYTIPAWKKTLVPAPHSQACIPAYYFLFSMAMWSWVSQAEVAIKGEDYPIMMCLPVQKEFCGPLMLVYHLVFTQRSIFMRCTERLLRRLLNTMFTACLVSCWSWALCVGAGRWAFGIMPQHRYKSFIKSCGWGWISRTTRWEAISPWILFLCLRCLCCQDCKQNLHQAWSTWKFTRRMCSLVITLTSYILLGSEHLVLPLSRGNWGHWSSHKLLGISI